MSVLESSAGAHAGGALAWATPLRGTVASIARSWAAAGRSTRRAHTSVVALSCARGRVAGAGRNGTHAAFGRRREWQGARVTAPSPGSDVDLGRGFQQIDLAGFFRNQMARDGGKWVWSVIAANVAVFLVWKIPNHRIFGFMMRNFVSSANLVRSGRFWTLLTANYSHKGFIHLGVNMFAVAHFSPEIIHTGYSRYQLEFTPAQWFGMYTAAGIVGASMSALFSLLQGTAFIPSLGASAAGFAVLTFYMLEYPKSKLYVMGIPMTCEQALLLSLLVNGGGVVVSFFRHVGVDFMAHLGGILVAMAVHDRVKQRWLGRSKGSSWPW